MAVTSYPVIIVDSTDANSSDSSASGAGPSTAITGSSASTDSLGTTVTLDGSPDLSSVATDGSHVIYLADSSGAGNRRFAAINAVDNVAKTVTVEQAYAASLTGVSWAIGGKRATLFTEPSVKLLENNSAAGDAMAGWTMEMQSGHTESTTLQVDFGRREGNTTDGDITIRGVLGTTDAQIPKVSTSLSSVDSINFAFLRLIGSYLRLEDFQITTTSVSHNADGVSLNNNVCDNVVLRGMIVGSDSAHTGFKTGISVYLADLANTPVIENCCSQYNNIGIKTNNYRGLYLRNCVIRNNTSHGIEFTQTSAGLGSHVVENCLIVDNGGHGILEAALSSARGTHGGTKHIAGCTIANNTGDGIRNQSDSSKIDWGNRKIADCIFSGNGGYAVNCTGTIIADEINAGRCTFFNNVIYGNTSGSVYPSSVSDIFFNTNTSNPSFVDESAGDYTPSSSMDGLSIGATRRGQPVAGSNSVGAIQRVVTIDGTKFHPLS